MAIERRTKVTESCKEAVRAALFTPVGPYTSDDVKLIDVLPEGEFTGKLDTTYVAAGYSFDDGGRQGEAGSDLVRYIWTLEYMVIGLSGVWGKNVADTVANTFKIEDNVPLLDIGGTRAPTGETVVVTYSQAQRVVVRAPRPWETNIWMTRVKLEDYFYSSRP
jgi:hypothetical protein